VSQQEKIRNLDFSKRLREAREILGITQDSLGKLWEVDGNYIYILESGKRGFPKKWQIKVLDLEDQVRKKFESRNIPVSYPPHTPNHDQIDEAQAEKSLSPVDTLLRESLISGEVKPAIPEVARMRRAPVVGFVAGAALLGERAYNYTDMANQIEDTFPTDCRDPNAIALIVEGDSMYPECQAGDWVLVSPNSEPRNEDVVVARLHEEGTVLLKKFFRSGVEGRTIKLVSTNPDYGTIVKDINEFRFIYPVVEIKRKRRR
jgi:phage repressor protein C with HTH and peptisase S24 domain/DNA-binding XRE family transcriptional regulator